MISIVDLREEFKKKNLSPLSEQLQEAIFKRLALKEQVILFLNRRGIASCILCRDCGHIPMCDNCDVSLTYHKVWKHGSPQHLLMCHYCGHTHGAPQTCPACNSAYIKNMGLGTQRLEEEVKKTFPNARVARLDGDTSQSKTFTKDLHKKLHNNEIDILIGTQIVAKGLDLPKVTLVGVILAEVGLSIPDFRALERTYQLLTQVTGRVSRRGQPGEVIVQTYSPEDISKELCMEQRYEDFYKKEIAERDAFGYPPFTEIIKLIFVDPSQKIALEESKSLLKTLEDCNNKLPSPCALTRAPALIPKLHNKYHMHIIIRGNHARELLDFVYPLPKGWRIDVDPSNCT